MITHESEEREKDGTSFQDETDSDNTSLTIGADYPLSEKLVGGVALSVKNEDGDFESGGGFDNDTTGVFLAIKSQDDKSCDFHFTVSTAFDLSIVRVHPIV